MAYIGSPGDGIGTFRGPTDTGPIPVVGWADATGAWPTTSVVVAKTTELTNAAIRRRIGAI
ncbi:hypothetical protein [Dietzia sp. B32]|uniref:hypothetical protein n=1 Tax=Dietzia sp. B32 TaxID=2915130 RepID=UPI0021AD809D|nr:hypothetical protein [Dietzia sp. B32]UVE94635.1 hypothetical protein L8M95_14055 [Dietzia sp. B32]